MLRDAGLAHAVLDSRPSFRTFGELFLTPPQSFAPPCFWAMLRRRLPRPPKASPMLLAGCPECTGTIHIYQSHRVNWFDAQPPYGRPACTHRGPSTTTRQATFDTRGSRFWEIAPLFRTGSCQYMCSTGLSQKDSARFRETGRHELGSHNHGVGACVECRCTTLRAHKSSFIESHGYRADC